MINEILIFTEGLPINRSLHVRAEVNMNKTDIVGGVKSIHDLSDEQLAVCKAILEKTKKYFFRNELRKLERIEKQAILYDLKKFVKVKNLRYKLRMSNPDDWIKEWEVYRKINEELKLRQNTLIRAS